MDKEKVIVIGGGASGLVAAIAAARRGYQVDILEKNDRVGRKILATGNGRCNYTNINISSYNYYSKNKKIVDNIIDKFSPERIVGFFRELGIQEYVDEAGKIYPNSLQASSVLDVLRMECKYLGVKEICDSEVVGILKQDDRFKINTIKDTYTCDKVVAAFGGKASPQLSSDGTGYPIMEKIGHSITPVFPGLVQLKLDSKYLKRISGIKVDGEISVEIDGNEIKRDYGEILFTNYGISGPPVLQLSRHCIDRIEKNKKVVLKLDIFPKYDKNELFQLLENRFINMKYKTIKESFIGLINKGLIDVVLKESGIENTNIPGTKFKTKDIYKIVNTLKEWKFHVLGPYYWEHAQVTVGGINTKEIDPNTMESKILKDLYITGELMDVDGDCGGYNLHWAWATGYTAGRSL
ncbi:MAG: NAD(P)/FAD-dependent oxidoreductase [Bacillota bacterium]|nr:NAD(P)/FAD-dependent oxidoreductase [Bacillota bacterium]